MPHKKKKGSGSTVFTKLVTEVREPLVIDNFLISDGGMRETITDQQRLI
jgi:hypothetical protein